MSIGLQRLCCLIFSAWLASPVAAQDAQPLTLEEVTQLLGYSAGDVEKLRGGEIISKDVERQREDQLRASVGMAIDAPLTSIAEGLKEARYLNIGSSTLGFGELSTPMQESEWQEVGFTAEESDEIKKLAEAKPGSDFNLSTEEFALLDERLGGEADAAAASAVYRDILIGRFNAYQDKGVAGISPYDRGGDTSSPADEIRAVEQRTADNIGARYPAFIAAVTEFPAGQSPDIANRFFWKKLEVEDRPAFVLIHQAIEEGSNYILASARQYFVGHTYNSLQAFSLAMQEDDKTYVFQVNTTATDQITGLFSGIASSVGQPRIRESLQKFFDKARAETP